MLTADMGRLDVSKYFHKSLGAKWQDMNFCQRLSKTGQHLGQQLVQVALDNRLQAPQRSQISQSLRANLSKIHELQDTIDTSPQSA